MAKKNKNQVKELIVETIKKTKWLSYPQLVRLLRNEGVEVDGTYQLEMKEKNIVLWGGLSKVVVDAIVDLMQENVVVGLPAPIELYRMDGFSFDYPVVFKLPEDKLKAPAVFLTFLNYVPESKRSTTLDNVTPLLQ